MAAEGAGRCCCEGSGSRRGHREALIRAFLQLTLLQPDGRCRVAAEDRGPNGVTDIDLDAASASSSWLGFRNVDTLAHEGRDRRYQRCS